MGSNISLDEIRHAIENDFDTRRQRNVKSSAKVQGFELVMQEILELPVAAWDDPGTVAGEIDTERKRE